MNINTIDLIQTNTLLKKNAEKIQKNVVKQNMHIESTLYLLNQNIDYLKFVVSKYKNTEKYEYLYNYILNQYNFKMAEHKSVDTLLRKHGIYRIKSFARIKFAVASILIILSAIPFMILGFDAMNMIIMGIVLCLITVATILKFDNFLEYVQFSKIEKSFKGN